MIIQITGVDLTLLNRRVLNHIEQKARVRRQAEDLHLTQSKLHLLKSLRASGGMRDQLGHHRVIERRNVARMVKSRVDTHALGPMHIFRASRCGQKALGRVLGIDAHLDGHAIGTNLLLGRGQAQTGRDPDLPLHEIPSGDLFGDRMLNLQAGIDFKEEKLILRIHDEFECACITVIDRTGTLDCGVQQLVSQGRGQRHSRRFLEHLLMATLKGTLPLKKMHDLPLAVSHDLNLDMARPVNVALNNEPAIPKIGTRQTDRLLARRGPLTRVTNDLHPLAASARAGLEQQRQPQFLDHASQTIQIIAGLAGSRNRRDACGLHDALGLSLVTKHANHLWRGADENQASGLHCLGEVRVFR